MMAMEGGNEAWARS